MKAKILITCWFTVLLQLLILHSYGQTPAIKVSSCELVYLHTDRLNYFIGEPLFFKAYVLNDLSNRYNSLSDTLYVALIDQDGLEVASGKFPVKNYQTEGNIGLSQFLKEGNYVLIACTSRMKNAAPDRLFSKIIEVNKSKKSGITIDLRLKDTLYTPGSLLTADIRFFGKNYNPVATSFTYRLQGTRGEIYAGKGKAKEDGRAIVAIPLPAFKSDDTMELLVATSYKGENIVSGIVIPTSDNHYDSKVYPERMVLNNKYKHLNIRIKTDKPQYTRNEKVLVDINVTNDQGIPVVASLSVSASDFIPDSILSQDDDVWNCLRMNSDKQGFNQKWRNIVSEMKQNEVTGIKNEEGVFDPKTVSVFNCSLRKFFGVCLSLIIQSPGYSFIVQEKNDPEKIRKKQESGYKIKQYGYPADRNILDIIRQIKPYQLVGGKIIFASSGFNSLNFQDGALIVIDGIKMGTDAVILNSIPVTDIARINVSTNPIDIQRYTGLNSVGIIEIFMKKGPEVIEKKEPISESKSSALLWEPDILTDRSGKASVSFFNNKSSEVIIAVEGITESGLAGSNTIKFSVK